MKKLVLFVFSFIVATGFVSAQRYAIIDTKFILDKMPEYKNADQQLAQIGTQWQREIDDKQAQLTMMYRNFDAERSGQPYGK
jgi:outer membrane protein